MNRDSNGGDEMYFIPRNAMGYVYLFFAESRECVSCNNGKITLNPFSFRANSSLRSVRFMYLMDRTINEITISSSASDLLSSTGLSVI